jgi:hypothetical protein
MAFRQEQNKPASQSLPVPLDPTELFSRRSQVAKINRRRQRGRFFFRLSANRKINREPLRSLADQPVHTVHLYPAAWRLNSSA